MFKNWNEDQWFAHAYVYEWQINRAYWRSLPERLDVLYICMKRIFIDVGITISFQCAPLHQSLSVTTQVLFLCRRRRQAREKEGCEDCEPPRLTCHRAPAGGRNPPAPPEAYL